MGDTNNNLNNNVVTPQTNIESTVPNTAPVQTQVVEVAPAQPIVEVTPVSPIQPVVEVAPTPAPVQIPVTPVTPVTPVQPVAPVVEPTPVTPVTPVQPVEQEKTISPINSINTFLEKDLSKNEVKAKINLEDLIVPNDDKDKNDNKEDKKKSDDINIELGENKKVPVVVLAIFFLVLAVVVVYYYIVMTPEHVMDNAVNNLYNTVDEIYNNIKSDNDLGVEVNVKLQTGVQENKYFENVNFNGKAFIKWEEQKAILSVSAEENDNMSGYDAKMYINDGIYISNTDMEKLLNGKVIKYDNELLDTYGVENLEPALQALESLKDHIINVSENEFLSRKITTIDINGQTTIAMKATADLDKDEFEKFYKDTIKGLLEDNNALIQFSNFSGYTVEEVKKCFNWAIAEDFDDDSSILIHLYMNLANTQLISAELTIDEQYYVKVDNLNGYYFVTIKTLGQQTLPEGTTLKEFKEPGFYLNFEFDTNEGIINGTGNSRVPGKNNLYAEYHYKRRTNEADGTKLGNTVEIDFYDYYNEDEEALKKELEANESHLIAHVDATLDIYRSEADLKKNFGTKNEKTGEYEIVFKGEKDVLENVSTSIKEQSKEGTFKLQHYIKYCGRYLANNLLSNEAYDKKYLSKKIEESGYTLSELESEKSRAESECDGVTVPITGRIRISEKIDGMTNYESMLLLDEEETAINWACLFENTNDEYYVMNFDDFADEIKKNNNKKNNVLVESIEVSPTEITLKVGETQDLIVTTHGEGDELTYKSKDTSIATIENKTVTAKKEGTTQIVIATKKGVSKKVTVTVTK